MVGVVARRRLATLVGAAVLVGAALTACEPTPIPTEPGTTRVVLLGDSVPAWLVRDGFAAFDTSKTTLIDGTLPACDGVNGNPPARSRTGALVPTAAGCNGGWSALYPPEFTIRADTAVLMTSTHAMLDHKLDGTWRHPCHAPAKSWYQADLNARLRYLATKADRVVVVLPAWPGPNSGWIMPTDYLTRADCVRSVVKAAATGTGAVVLDFGAYLCPAGKSACAPWRTKDGMHIDTAKAPAVLTWLISQAQPIPAS